MWRHSERDQLNLWGAVHVEHALNETCWGLLVEEADFYIFYDSDN